MRSTLRTVSKERPSHLAEALSSGTGTLSILRVPRCSWQLAQALANLFNSLEFNVGQGVPRYGLEHPQEIFSSLPAPELHMQACGTQRPAGEGLWAVPRSGADQ